MTTGLSFPVKVNKRGGAVVLKDTEQLKKLLILAFSENEDNNPFQDIGFSKKIIFAQTSTITFSDIKQEIERIIKTFDGRITLAKERPIVLDRQETGEIIVTVKWVDTLSDIEEEQNFRIVR